MVKLKILSVGKIKEQWLHDACEEYCKRLSPWASLHYQWVRDDLELMQAVEKEKSLVLLDPNGQMFTSPQFAVFLMEKIEASGSQLTFVIGGAEGLPEKLKERGVLVSLSKMTLTHQMSRLILTEQIYRSFMIDKGKSYHK